MRDVADPLPCSIVVVLPEATVTVPPGTTVRRNVPVPGFTSRLPLIVAAPLK